jgi:hypothetical protein
MPETPSKKFDLGGSGTVPVLQRLALRAGDRRLELPFVARRCDGDGRHFGPVDLGGLARGRRRIAVGHGIALFKGIVAVLGGMGLDVLLVGVAELLDVDLDFRAVALDQDSLAVDDRLQLAFDLVLTRLVGPRSLILGKRHGVREAKHAEQSQARRACRFPGERHMHNSVRRNNEYL